MVLDAMVREGADMQTGSKGIKIITKSDQV